ncbi:MAG: hypothetical protein IJ666_04355 [Ruminococcus sp.]|nr:hypothetical protein [Ruminococcus sp.]
MNVQLAEYHLTNSLLAERIKNLTEENNIEINGIYDPFVYVEGSDVYITAPLEIFDEKSDIKSQLYTALEYSLKDYAAQLRDFTEDLYKTDKIDFRIYAEDV